MNTSTGEIEYFESEDTMRARQAQLAALNQRLIALKNPPKTNCNKCHGIGHIGRDATTGEYIPCGCCK